MKPREFTDFATKLASTSAEPAECRTAISRAYYGAYHETREQLDRLGFRIEQNYRAHTEVRVYLEKSNDPVVIKLAQDLRNLHQSRKRADYNLGDTGIESQKTANAITRRAQQVVAELDRQCTGAASAAIVQAIKAWRAAGGRP